jgi:hypothetical protein
MSTLFRITHSAPFNISIQALVLIEKVSSANQVRPKHLGENGEANANYSRFAVNLRQVLPYSLRLPARPSATHFFKTGHVSQPALQSHESRYLVSKSYSVCQKDFAVAHSASATFYLWSLVPSWRG